MDYGARLARHDHLWVVFGATLLVPPHTPEYINLYCFMYTAGQQTLGLA